MQPKVSVFVGNFGRPPRERFARAIQAILPQGFEPCDAHIVMDDPEAESAMMKDVIGCVRYTLGWAQKLMHERPESSLAASIVPLQIEFNERPDLTIMQSMVFVGVRNASGNEWIYGHFVDRIRVPVEVTHMLAEQANQVLEERGTLESVSKKSEVLRAVKLISTLAQGVELVLRNASKGVRMQS